MGKIIDISLSDENRCILKIVPERWGRMDPLSQAALLQVGHLLKQNGLLNENNQVPAEKHIGLIVGTQHGCLSTDLAYSETLALGPQFASPALFGYTLPNIPLAETAVHYKLTGPVFSIFADNPMQEAQATAQEWLADSSSPCSTIIAGELDLNPPTEPSTIIAQFTICHA